MKEPKELMIMMLLIALFSTTVRIPVLIKTIDNKNILW